MTETNTTTGGNGAITRFDPETAYQMAGSESTDFKTSRVVIHQGDISERDYGAQRKGTLIAHDTKQPLADQDLRFCVISAWKEYIRWREDRAAGPLYRTLNVEQVPPEDLQWRNNKPPRCIIYYNFAVMVAGETLPMILSMKNSERHTRVFAETLHKYESARVALQQTRGLYRLCVIDASNQRGNWKAPLLEPVGDAPADMLADAVAWSKTAFATKASAADRTPAAPVPPAQVQPTPVPPPDQADPWRRPVAETVAARTGRGWISPYAQGSLGGDEEEY